MTDFPPEKKGYNLNKALDKVLFPLYAGATAIAAITAAVFAYLSHK